MDRDDAQRFNKEVYWHIISNCHLKSLSTVNAGKLVFIAFSALVVAPSITGLTVESALT